MNQYNYHTHTSYSDGQNTITAYLEQAAQLNLQTLGFSDHAPVPLECDWAMPAGWLQDYRREIQSAQTAWQDRIEVYCGLEIDYIPGKITPRDLAFEELELDYTIGSVHFVDQFEDGTPWSIDSSLNIFRAGLKQIFDNDVRLVIHRYFQLIRDMITQAPPTIVAHLDRIKKHNPHHLFFDEREDWYRSEVVKTLECIAAHKVILEVNTKSLYRTQLEDPQPGRWTLAVARKMGIPVHLASDAHRITDVTGAFPAALRVIWEAGYREVMLLSKGEWRLFPIHQEDVMGQGRGRPILL